jgi:hypothetical protein
VSSGTCAGITSVRRALRLTVATVRTCTKGNCRSKRCAPRLTRLARDVGCNRGRDGQSSGGAIAPGQSCR